MGTYKVCFSAHTFQITDNHLTTHGKLSSENNLVSYLLSGIGRRNDVALMVHLHQKQSHFGVMCLLGSLIRSRK